MFSWFIPLLVGIAVFLLSREIQQAQQAFRIRQQVLAVSKRISQPSTKQDATSLSPWFKKHFFKIIASLGQKQKSWVPLAWGRKVGKKLIHLPPWQDRDPAQWLAMKEITGALGALIGWLLNAGWGISLGLALAAFFLPDLWLQEKYRLRQQAILRELPDTLDLLAACLEAGLGLESALHILLERGKSSPLWLEFREMLRTINIGQSRADALRAMSERIEHADFTTFVTAWLQAERLGVGVAETLKIQASQMRDKRSQQIEKQALEAPVKLLFPLIVFIFPVVFVILFGPILIRFLQGF